MCHAAKALLAGRIPDLQLDAHVLQCHHFVLRGGSGSRNADARIGLQTEQNVRQSSASRRPNRIEYNKCQFECERPSMAQHEDNIKKGCTVTTKATHIRNGGAIKIDADGAPQRGVCSSALITSRRRQAHGSNSVDIGSPISSHAFCGITQNQSI